MRKLFIVVLLALMACEESTPVCISEIAALEKRLKLLEVWRAEGLGFVKELDENEYKARRAHLERELNRVIEYCN